MRCMQSSCYPPPLCEVLKQLLRYFFHSPVHWAFKDTSDLLKKEGFFAFLSGFPKLLFDSWGKYQIVNLNQNCIFMISFLPTYSLTPEIYFYMNTYLDWIEALVHSPSKSKVCFSALKDSSGHMQMWEVLGREITWFVNGSVWKEEWEGRGWKASCDICSSNAVKFAEKLKVKPKGTD